MFTQTRYDALGNVVEQRQPAYATPNPVEVINNTGVQVQTINGTTYLTWLVTTSANRPSLFGNGSLLNSDSHLYYFCLIGFLLCLVAVRSLRRSRPGSR